MGNGWIRRGLLVALLALGAGCPGLLAKDSGKPKVAILEIEGARSERIRGEIRERVAEMVAADDFQVLGPKAYRTAARRQGVEGTKKRDIVKVSEALDLDAVVHARLFRKGRASGRLGLTVRDGHTGAVVDRFSVILRRGEPKGRQRRKLSTKLFLALDEIAASHRAIEKRKAEEEKRKQAEREEAEREAEEREEQAKKEENAEEDGKVARGDEREEKEKEKEEEEDPEPLDLETDDSGQVIDEEMPDVLDD